MPLGVILARHLKRFEGPTGSIWFRLHRVCQSIALLIGTAGFATGIYMGNQPGIHNTPHRCVGITLMILALAQVCVAVFLRPNKDHKYRIWWNNFYFLVGYTTIVLAICNVFKGFDILGGKYHVENYLCLCNWIFGFNWSEFRSCCLDYVVMEQEEQRAWSIGKIRLKSRIIAIGIKIFFVVFAYYVEQSLLLYF